MLAESHPAVEIAELMRNLIYLSTAHTLEAVAECNVPILL